MPEQPLEPELTALERSLARLEPAAQLSRDRLFFRAGRAKSSLRWLWPASTVVSTLVAGVLGVLLWQQSLAVSHFERPRIIVVEKLVPVPMTPETPALLFADPPRLDGPGQGTATQDYLKLRQGVVRWGADVLHSPPPQTTEDDPLTPADVPRLSPPQPGRHGFFRFIPFSSGGGS